MNVVPFIADDAVDAVTQIRAQLGPEAVVVNIRQLPATGLSRLWRRSRIEVLAGVPAEQGTTAPSLLDVRDSFEACVPAIEQAAIQPDANTIEPKTFSSAQSERANEWRSQTVLEAMGISSIHAERVIQQLRRDYGEQPPASLRSEIAITRAALTSLWRNNKSVGRGLHVFIGAPGSGKSTALAKWLTQLTLMNGASARVWRLDVPRANTAEALNVHCEILNVPIERMWNPAVTWPEEHLFIDLPGIEASNEEAMAQLENLLNTMRGASVSLVLNAAYEITLLQAQARAFARLPITDLLFTHLDEELRWSKLWNFVLGTNYSLSFLSAGQNIPGRFLRAAPEALFPATFRESELNS
jgi:flagellar biosynthesis protein FlhF